MFNWLKNRRRQKLLATPIPPAWDEYLAAVGYFHFLPAADQSRLRDAARIFIAEKTWEGCKGLELTEEMQVTVAAMACILVLGLDDFYFDNVQTILMYPQAFVAREQRGFDGTEYYIEGDSERIGEAHYRGPVILTWEEVRLDAAEPGQGGNLVFHEFAHQLDMLNGAVDGVPLLPAALEPRWQSVMKREFAKLGRRAERGRETLLDPYGATDPAEFFAVVTECFFDLPRALEEEHRELYDLLREFYRQDPARWDRL